MKRVGEQSRLAASFLPPAAVLEMTYRCNHACVFCSCPWLDEHGVFDIRPELTVAQWRDTITMLCRMGVTDIALTGGEPLLKQGIGEIIEHAAACQAEFVESQDGGLVTRRGPPRLTLLTNGRCMTEQVLALCRKHAVHLGMSLPGLAGFAEHTRGGEVSQVLHWFGRARAEDVRTHVGITVTRKNLGELYEAMAQALLAGADSVLLNRFLPGGRGLRHADALMLDADGMRQMLAVAEQVLRLANRRGHVGTELPQCLIDPARHTHLEVGSQCSAVTRFFVIDPSGYLRVCNHSPVRLQHVSQIAQVKDHPYWRRFAQKDYLPEACRGCALHTRCDGGCREAAHVYHGRLDALDPSLPCARPREAHA